MIVKLDGFANEGAQCCFLRLAVPCETEVRFVLAGAYRVSAAEAGGWLLLPIQDIPETYWIPQLPRIRRVDAQGHILEERDVAWRNTEISPSQLMITVRVPGEWVFDWLLWQVPSVGESVCELQKLLPLEAQPHFLWGSHTVYRQPAGLYEHLVAGHCYENRFAWPKRWRICSENDAYALYTLLRGLRHATGKSLYGLFQKQLVLSVLDRQGEDGGWRHGEWTDDMESHYRLHCSAMHMLMDALEERDDPTLRNALRRAAAFIAQKHDRLAKGIWFLHDDLERSVEGMNRSPFPWYSSRALGKSPSNMLVLNTHLDATIALDRYGQLTGDFQYLSLVDSAREATRAVLALDRATPLYRALFWAIGLTLLPTPVAKALPLPLRAVKRFAGKVLIPRLARIKTAFPRLRMPDGYVDRALSVGTLSDAYLSVNAMDLARYLRRFGENVIRSTLEGAIAFGRTKGLLARWREDKAKEYALGFWAEALYHLCTIDPSPAYRAMLAEAILALDDQDLGMVPSLLGANAEAVPRREQLACPCSTGETLRVANLSRGGRMELIVVNPANRPIALAWSIAPCRPLRWSDGATASSGEVRSETVPARGWLWGREIS